MKLFFKKNLKENNIIRNMPRTMSFMPINNIYTINNNYLLTSFISKKYIINNEPKVFRLQNQIRKYIYYKKAKEEYFNPRNTKLIIKNCINKAFMITKEQKTQKENIDKIEQIQKYFKKRFKYLKNNILKLPQQKKNQTHIYSRIQNNNNNKNINKITNHYEIKEENIILSSLMKQNKKPICLKGFFCDKVRINQKSFEKFYFISNISNRGIYISKYRIKNNNKNIEKIQNVFRKIKKEKDKKDNIPIIKKPKIGIYELVNYNKKNLNEKSKTIIEPPIYNDFIGEKIYTVYNKRYLSHMCHINMNNFYYISKIRKFNDNIDINSSKEYESILNEIETRKNFTLNNKNNNEAEPNFLLSEIISEVNKNKDKNNKINVIPLNIENNNDEQYEIDKEHLTFREINSENENGSILKPINKKCYIEKTRFKNDEIFTKIKNYYKKCINENGIIIDKKYINNIIKKNSNHKDENINIIRNNILLSDTQIKSSRINIDNNKINAKESSMNSKYSEILSNRNNIIHIKKEKNLDKEKRKHQNININNKINYFQNKTNYIYFFRHLQLFLVKNIQEYIFYRIKGYIMNYSNRKNNKIKDEIQFQYDMKNAFDFPFYIKALYRCYIYYKNTNNENFKNFFREAFPLIDKDKTFYYNLVYLSSQNKKKLISTNLFNVLTEKNELIQFLNSFASFDKHISTQKLFINLINEYTFYNTNIFTLIKFVDINFCNSISKEMNKNIEKEKINYEIINTLNNYSDNGSDIEILDSEINDTDNSRKIDINFFIYDQK